MWIRRLQLQDVRAVALADLECAAGFNLLVGANGAGKTSILEAIHILSVGRSFRSARVSAVVRRGAGPLGVAAEVVDPEGQAARLRARRGRGTRELRINGEPCPEWGEAARRMPVQVIDPSAHGLVEGSPRLRRRFLDRGVFHVEPDFLGHWRTYHGALRQRNSALRGSGGPQLVQAWDAGLVQSGAALDQARARHVQAVNEELPGLMAALGWSLGALCLSYRSGWGVYPPLEALRRSAGADRQRGHTTVGSHRAELLLELEGRAAAPELSRGQQKLVAVGLLLAQARGLARLGTRKPILLLDDIAAELDVERRRGLMGYLADLDHQLFATAVEGPAPDGPVPDRVFHVEQGRVRPVL